MCQSTKRITFTHNYHQNHFIPTSLNYKLIYYRCLEVSAALFGRCTANSVTPRRSVRGTDDEWEAFCKTKIHGSLE